MVGSLKKQNLESKVLIANGEEWVDEEESSHEEVKKDVCLMVVTSDFVTDETDNNSSTFFEANLTKASSDSKFKN